MKANKQYTHLHICRSGNQTSAHFRRVISDKIVDATLMLVSLAGLLCAVTFLMTMW